MDVGSRLADPTHYALDPYSLTVICAGQYFAQGHSRCNRREMGLPNQTRFRGNHDGSIAPGSGYARYFNEVSRPEGNRRQSPKVNIDAARGVGGKTCRPPGIVVRIVVGDNYAQTYRITLRRLLAGQIM